MTSDCVESTLRPTIPGWKETSLLAMSQFAVALVVLFLWPDWLGYSIATVCCAAGAVFVTGLLAPSRFRRGVRTTSTGFELWRPLCNPVHIVYEDIEKIVAVSRGEGDSGDELNFVVHTKVSRASILEFDLYSTELFQRLSSLPGFLQSEFERAANHEATFLQAIVGKRFMLLDRQQ